ncbi:MAG: integrin alpha [Pseudomonadota bacterium]
MKNLMKISFWIAGLSFLITNVALAEPLLLNMETDGIIDVRLDSQTVITGSRLGESTVIADFDNDGIDDLVVAAPGTSSPRGITKAGAVYFFFGGSTVNNLPAVSVYPDDNQADFYLYGDDIDAYLGEMLVAGDVNADGISDLIIVGQKDTVSDKQSRIYVILGRTRSSFPSGATAIGTLADSLLTYIPGVGGSNQDIYPDHICGLAIGDLNGDNINDLALCDVGKRQFQVVFGKQQWAANITLDTDADVLLKSQTTEPLFTTTGLSKRQGLLLEDMNNDGIADLLVGLREGDLTSPALEDSGMIYLFNGSRSFPADLSLDMADVTISGALNRDFAGEVLVAGDVNGNGKKDLIIGNPDSSLGIVSATGYGRVQVLYDLVDKGATIDLFTAADVSLKAGDIGRIGFKTGSTIIVRDINNDQFDDLIIGTPNGFVDLPPGGTNGWIHVIYGSNSLNSEIILETDADIFIKAPIPTHPLTSARVSSAMAAGDINNDGKIDLVAGGPNGLSISSGWTGILYGLAEKQAGGTNNDPQATLDKQTFELYLPVVTVTGSPLTLWVRMNIVDPLQLVFEVSANGYGATDETSTNAANFDGATGRLTIPSLEYDNIFYTFEMVAVSVEPLRFQIDLTSLKVMQ